MRRTPTLVALENGKFASSHCLDRYGPMSMHGMIETAWEHVAEQHSEGGPWYRPEAPGRGERVVYFVRYYKIVLEDHIAARAAVRSGFPIVTMTRAAVTITPETADERDWFAVLRSHWATPMQDIDLMTIEDDEIAGMVSRNSGLERSGTPYPVLLDAILDALDNYGIGSAASFPMDLGEVCDREGRDTARVRAGGLSIAEKIVASVLSTSLATGSENVLC